MVSDGRLGCLRSRRGGLQESSDRAGGRLFGFHPNRSPTLPPIPPRGLSASRLQTGTTVGFEGFEGGERGARSQTI